MSNYPFDFLRMNKPEKKPRKRGVTEIRGPYYTVMGKRYTHPVSRIGYVPVCASYYP